MDTKAQLARLGLFDAKVPRYTSYPTSPHFSGAIGSATFADWARAIPENGEVSLYVHVPFCRRLCWFCACRTQGTSTDSPVIAYLEVLKAELRMLGEILPSGVRLSRLHWGGGTPTLLGPGLITDLAAAIRDAAPFAPDYEFSVEIDPCEVDDARLDALAAAGMNRASIGVQDFDPEIQKMIGRPQSFEDTRRVVESIRARGVHSLNADILFGLPHQDRAKITDTVQKLLSFSPDRVALYGYAHVPWMAKRQQMIPSDALPTPEERLDLFEAARRLFVWDGYKEIGIDHFAKPDDGMARAQATGQLRRNFQGYTHDPATALIGVGASSISRFPQGYTQNHAATGSHTAAIRAGRFSTHRGHAFTPEDLLRGRIIEALMCDFVVRRAEILDTHAVTEERLDMLLRAACEKFPDMLRCTDEGLFIPHAARPLTRMIARHFDAYDLSKSGHSSAI